MYWIGLYSISNKYLLGNVFRLKSILLETVCVWKLTVVKYYFGIECCRNSISSETVLSKKYLFRTVTINNINFQKKTIFHDTIPTKINIVHFITVPTILYVSNRIFSIKLFFRIHLFRNNIFQADYKPK